MTSRAALLGGATASMVATSAILNSAQVLAAPGDLIWQDQIDAGFGEFDDAEAVAVQGNRVVVAGQIDDGTGTSGDWFVRAYDAASGAELWSDQFDLAGGDDDTEAVLIQGSTVIVTGFVTNAAGDRDLFVRAYDIATGAVVWEDQYDNAGGDDEGRTIGIAAGRVIVGGNLENADFGFDWLVRAYDLDGNVLWEDVLPDVGDEGGVQDTYIGVQGSRVAVVGSVDGGSDSDWLVRTYDAATGEVLWEDQITDPDDDSKADAVTAHGNRLFVVGSIGGFEDEGRALIRAYDARTGELLWEDELAETSDYDVVVTSQNLVIAGGEIASPPGLDGLVRAYDRKGNLVWEDVFDLADYDDIDAAAAQSGVVVFTGEPAEDEGDEGADVMVRAYAAKKGNVLWQDLFDEAGGDDLVENGFSVAIGSGRVFVAIEVEDPEGDADWKVRAYELR